MTAGAEAFLRPRTIAVVGASRDPTKIGYRILRNIILSGFPTDRVFPVNPNATEILNLKCYASVLDIPGYVDLAVVAVPAKSVPAVLEECGRKGVRGVAVISSGFKEVGEVDLEVKLVEIARKYGFRLLGPNIVGVWDTSAKVNYSFIDAAPLPGSIAFLSQSGALITSLIWWTRERGIGFSSLVSIGNRADIGESDFLSFFREDSNTRVIAMYIEGLGTGEGRRFLDELAKTTPEKPVLVLKAGRSPEAAEAIKSHTGSLAGSNEAYEAALKQARVLRPSSLRELFNWALALALSPEPKGGNVVILTHGGGAGVLASDALSEWGVKLASITPDLAEELRKFMPPFGSVRNPVDLTGMMTASDLEGALTTLLRCDHVDAVLLWAGQGAIPTPDEIGEAVLRAVSEAGLRKPLVVSVTGGEESRTVLRRLISAGIPSYESPEEAASSLAAVYAYYRGRRKRGKRLQAVGDRKAAEAVIREALAKGCAMLAPMEAFKVAEAYGIATVKAQLATCKEEAVAAARELGYPVALAVETPDIAHKTEVGGIALNLGSDKEVEEAYTKVLNNVKAAFPNIRFNGVSVRKMMPRGLEVFVGCRRDPVFGPTVAFGWGGLMVELVKDVSIRVAPLTEEDLEEVIAETKVGSVLKGYRGKPLDIEAVKRAVLGAATLIESFEEVSEIDVNPLFVYEKGAVAVDVKVYLGSKRQEG